MSDIKFDGEFVIIEGNWTRAATLDLMLDAPSRRTNTSGFRRALVHDVGDGLTMNYANDYPSGVAINGARTISGHNSGDWIDVQSRVVDIAGTDVMLDSPGRRTNRTPFRRALVHDFNDGLTLNWNRDYPGGVTVNGARTVSGHNSGDWIDVQSRVVDIAGTDVMLDSPGRRTNTTPFRRALVHDFNDGLTLNWNRDYPAGITLNGPVNAPDSMTVDGRDVAALLDSLQSQVTALQSQVTTLQSQIGTLEARVDALEAG